MPFEIICNDITKLKADAIVNAANNELQNGGGVCGAIFTAAGADKLQKACDKIGGCETGQAVITKGYALPAKHIIHTVGPVWSGGDNGERDLLYSCYKNSMELAQKHGCKSVAFPLISSGIFGYPKDQALCVAVAAIGDFLLEHDMSVSLVVFDKAAYALSEKLYSSIKTFIDDHYAETHFEPSRGFDEASYYGLKSDPAARDEIIRELKRSAEERERQSRTSFSQRKMREERLECEQRARPSLASLSPRRSLDDVVSRLEEPFSTHLIRLIDEKGRTDTEVYKRANIDRRVFSRIRSKKDYRPSKNTALAFAIALELSLDDTKDLLMKAGYALSRSDKQDVIVEYFITEGNYNIFEINEALFAFDQSLLGA